MSKLDAKSAYRRATSSGLLSVMSITCHDNFALMMLCLTFGGANGLHDWPDMITEPLTDLGNDLLNYPYWNENEMHSPLIDKIGETILLLDLAPFGESIPLDVDVPVLPNGKWMILLMTSLLWDIKMNVGEI